MSFVLLVADSFNSVFIHCMNKDAMFVVSTKQNV
jgi:hypothetical protein